MLQGSTPWLRIITMGELNPVQRREKNMARTPMVTRTIQTTTCTVLCMDIENREPCNKTVTLPRTYKDENEMLKAAKKAVESDTIKCVQVVDHTVNETLYGMTEQDFINHASVLPPRKEYTNEE